MSASSTERVVLRVVGRETGRKTRLQLLQGRLRADAVELIDVDANLVIQRVVGVLTRRVIGHQLFEVAQRRRHLRLLFLFIAMGVVIEILQGQTTYRLFEFGDITANILGVLFAWILASTAYATLLLRTEKNVLFSNQRL